MGTILLWGITILWLIFICYLCKDNDFPSELNAIGDFFAGAFAPLAFFWLVSGFYQQGKGLKQNSIALKMQAKELEKTTKALELQVQEMKASVKQQSRLAQVYEDELQQKHFQVQPNLDYNFQIVREYSKDEPITDEENRVISSYKETIVELKLIVENLGEIARNLNIKSTTYPYIRKNKSKFEHSGILDINFEINGQAAAEITDQESYVTFLFEVTYQNLYGKRYRNNLTCVVRSVYDRETNQISLSPYLEKLQTVVS